MSIPITSVIVGVDIKTVGVSISKYKYSEAAIVPEFPAEIVKVLLSDSVNVPPDQST